MVNTRPQTWKGVKLVLPEYAWLLDTFRNTYRPYDGLPLVEDQDSCTWPQGLCKVTFPAHVVGAMQRRRYLPGLSRIEHVSFVGSSLG